MVLTNREGVGGRGYRLEPVTGIATAESEKRFDFGIAREVLCACRIDGGALFIERIAALLAGRECFGNTVGIAEEEAGGVYEDAIAFFGFERESPDDGLGEGFGYCIPFLSIGRVGAVILVGLDEENFIKKGGGLWGLVIAIAIAAAVLLASDNPSTEPHC